MPVVLFVKTLVINGLTFVITYLPSLYSINSVAVITIGVAVISYFFIDAHKKIALRMEMEATKKSKDRFTVCIETVMSKAIEARQPISANEAKDICLQAERF